MDDNDIQPHKWPICQPAALDYVFVTCTFGQREYQTAETESMTKIDKEVVLSSFGYPSWWEFKISNLVYVLWL